MPPEGFFRSQGSNDQDAVVLKGNEFWKTLSYSTNKFSLGMCFFFAICAGCVPLLMNYMLGNVMTVVGSGDFTVSELKEALMFIVYAAIVNHCVMNFNFFFRGYASPLFMADLRDAVYRALMKKDMDYFDQTPTGALVGRLSQDIGLLYQIYVEKSCMVVQDCTQALGGLVMCMVIMWRVALPACGVMVLCGVVYIVGGHFIDKLWDQYNNSSSAATAKAEEVISCFRTIKAFDNELLEADRYYEDLKDINGVFDKTSIAQGIEDGLIMFLIHLMIAGFLYLASYFIMKKPEHGNDTGDIVVIMMSLVFSALGVSIGLSLSDDFKRARVSAAKILKILEGTFGTDANIGDKMDNVVGKIEFKDVGFKYATRDEWAVRHLSFVVEAGDTVALVGESGCGKSTTLQILQRFYEIQEGQILLDDVDIATLSPKFLRSHIAVVPQSPVLFTMSISDNITYSRGGATAEEVVDAARIGNAHCFIEQMPSSYESVVHQTSLSGGQKQRICISRAILTNARIFLLDEATAALDTESEQLVQQSLETFRHGRTVMLVAHRLATVINANRIFVLSEGHVAETGTHLELMAQNGLYSDLIKHQLQ